MLLNTDKNVACQNVKKTVHCVSLRSNGKNYWRRTDSFNCEELEKWPMRSKLLGYRDVYLDKTVHGDRYGDGDNGHNLVAFVNLAAQGQENANLTYIDVSPSG